MTFHPKQAFSLASAMMLAIIALPGLAFEVEPDTIREAVTAHVYEAIKKHTAAVSEQTRIDVEITQMPFLAIELPDSPETGDAKVIHVQTESPLSQQYSSRAVVRVKVSDEAGNNRSFGIPVRIKINKPVWVVRNNINAQQPLTRQDLALETREVSHTFSHVVGPERNLQEYIARVNLRPGEVLDDRKIAVPPDVTRNSEVQIFLGNQEGLSISVPGVALSDGRIGQTIRVRQTVFQKKDYQARILDKNRVFVDI